MSFTVPGRAEAITRVNGNFFLDESHGWGPQGDTNLFHGGVGLTIIPTTKKQLRSNLNVQFDYTKADGESAYNLSPIGNIGLNLQRDEYTLGLLHNRTTTINSAAQLSQTNVYRADLNLTLPDFPALNAGYTSVESITAGQSVQSDFISLYSSYRYKLLNFTTGYNYRTISGANQPSLAGSAFFFTTDASKEILPRTSLGCNYSFNRNASDTPTGFTMVTIDHAFGVNAASRPLWWLGVNANYFAKITDFESAPAKVTRTDLRNMSLGTDIDLSAQLIPGLRISPTVGNNLFNDRGTTRSVSFATVKATFDRKLRDRIGLNLLASRSYQWDPDQGKNTQDTFGLNSLMDLTPRISLQLNLGVNRSDDRTFVSTPQFDASGTLADRVKFDLAPAGFTFFDTVNSNLYTKNSAASADWSLPAHINLATDHFAVSKSIELKMFPTDRTTVFLSYSMSSSSDTFDFVKIGNQTINASLVYLPTVRTTCSFSMSASVPETGSASYSGNVNASYRFYRRHQLSVSYGKQISADRSSDSFAGSLGLVLPKQSSLNIAYSAAQLFQAEQAQIVRVEFHKSF